MRSVIRYWCCTLTSGTLTPAMRPSARDHWPAQQTALSQATKPWSVSTPVTRPASTRMPVTRTPSRIATPFCRAPRASACTRSDGEAWPSVGRNAAPTTSSTVISGQSSCASEGVSRCMSSPKERAVVACRFTSVQRSGVQASRRPPLRFQPVASPVSASSRS